MKAMKAKKVTTNNIFKDIGFSLEEAEHLRLRASLMLVAREYIEKEVLTQAEAAERFGVDQPQISRLMAGKIELFTVDKLILILSRVGIHVQLKVAA